LLTCFEQSFGTLNPGQRYSDNYHVEAMAYRLEQCFAGKLKRLIITIPPRHLKSQLVSVVFPAWVLGRDPTRRIIHVTYAGPLSDDLTRQTRMLVETPWYSATFPLLTFKSSTGCELVTTKGGYRYGTSTGGTLTGRGGNIIIIDDPLRADDDTSARAREDVIEWYRTSLVTRLDNPQDGVIIIVMQRLHELDLVGYLLETEPGQWTHLNLPAIADADELIPIGPDEVHRRKQGEPLDPVRLPLPTLDRLRAQMGSMKFSAQYQQKPVPADGNLIKRNWLKTYSIDPLGLPNRRVVQSWDTAMKPGEGNDYSVCLTIVESGGKSYLIDVVRKRVDYPELRRLAIELYEEQRPDAVLIEDRGSGTPLIGDLKAAGKQGVVAIVPKGDKEMRMRAQSAKIEAGDLLLPQGAPWLADLLAELLGFPRSRHDDQVDALSQHLGWISEQLRRSSFSYDMGWEEDQAVPETEQVLDLLAKFRG
jgi:predicted phage terminase large subunit-like protein